MLERYTTEEVKTLWGDQARLDRWVAVEIAVAKAHGSPPETLEYLRRCVPTLEAVQVQEKITGHDVGAFLDVWTRNMLKASASNLHRGLTSSDLVDTAQALTLKGAHLILKRSSSSALTAFYNLADFYQDTPTIGRTHGQHAEATTYGHRFGVLADGMLAARETLLNATLSVSTAKLSGPVGNYPLITREQERTIALGLGLRAPQRAATQVIPRDSLIPWITAQIHLVAIAEQFATMVRLGQQSEIAELAEPTGVENYTGSSSMPRKRNPSRSERICGLARVVRALAQPMLESTALWWERDISHSSVDRICLPTMHGLTEFILRETCEIALGLQVHAGRSRETLERAGSAGAAEWWSRQAGGASRGDGYAAVQGQNRLKPW